MWNLARPNLIAHSGDCKSRRYYFSKFVRYGHMGFVFIKSSCFQNAYQIRWHGSAVPTSQFGSQLHVLNICGGKCDIYFSTLPKIKEPNQFSIFVNYPRTLKSVCYVGKW
jgi:hypothetical protein